MDVKNKRNVWWIIQFSLRHSLVSSGKCVMIGSRWYGSCWKDSWIIYGLYLSASDTFPFCQYYYSLYTSFTIFTILPIYYRRRCYSDISHWKACNTSRLFSFFIIISFLCHYMCQLYHELLCAYHYFLYSIVAMSTECSIDFKEAWPDLFPIHCLHWI